MASVGNIIRERLGFPDGSGSIPFETLQGWFRMGVWAIADQGFFAASNFALNIMLARYLVPSEYGAFTLAFSLFLLLATIHSAFLTEPMLVFGPVQYEEKFKSYLGVILRSHWKLSALLGTALFLCGIVLWFADLKPVARATWALGVAAPFILLQWTMRRACYVRLEPRLASVAGAGYMLLIVVGAFVLLTFRLLSALSAFGLMAVASLAAALWMAQRLGLQLTGSAGNMSDARKDHWTYGRWAVGTGFLAWVPGNIFFWMLAMWGGLEVTGAFRALLNLLLPIIHINFGLGVLLVPALAKVRDRSLFRGRVMVAAALVTIGGVCYWLLLGSFHEPVLDLLYAGKYNSYASVLWLLGIIAVSTGVVAVAGAALAALARPDRVFWSWVFSSSVAVAAGLLLITSTGLIGAALGLVLASLTTAVVMSWYLWRVC